MAARQAVPCGDRPQLAGRVGSQGGLPQHPRAPGTSAGSLAGGVRVQKTPGLLPHSGGWSHVLGLVPDHGIADSQT